MSPIDEHRRHALYSALEGLIGTEHADTLISMLPPSTWDELATKDDVLAVKQDVLAVKQDVLAVKQDVLAVKQDLEHRMEVLEHKLMGTLHRELGNQTRTLAVGMVGAMAAMTSMCVAAITFAT